MLADLPAPVLRAQTIQPRMSPYDQVDFAPLAGADRAIDPVSLADIYRNSFVYPPHSIYRNVKLATFGFDPAQDLRAVRDYLPPDALFDRAPRPGARSSDAWLDPFHQILCAAFDRSCAGLSTPWMLQSGGKDSTALAIAAASVRPDVACLTYLGGREENEVESARAIAKQLGLRHEAMVCDAGRAYDRYLAAVPTMPLVTADFALLSYVDALTEIKAMGGDGAIDGVGADVYFGAPLNRTARMLQRMTLQLRLPPRAVELLLQRLNSFRLGYALSSLQMHPFERMFPGSRFSDTEVDELFGQPLSQQSKQRRALYQTALGRLGSAEDQRVLSLIVADAAGGLPKGLYSARALGMQTVYPFCDRQLMRWVCEVLPPELRMDAQRGINKVLVRAYIARQFGDLPYVTRKGSFRFDLRALAAKRFDQVLAFAEQASDHVPGAPVWLRRNHRLMGHKSQASKFYLLAVTLPWLCVHGDRQPSNQAPAAAELAAAGLDMR